MQRYYLFSKEGKGKPLYPLVCLGILFLLVSCVLSWFNFAEDPTNLWDVDINIRIKLFFILACIHFTNFETDKSVLSKKI